MSKKLCANPACKVKFEPKRKTALYHTPACRIAAARAIGADPDTGELPELPKETSATPTKDPNPFAASNRDPNYDGDAALKSFQKMGIVKTDWIPTGIAEFDALTQIPLGRITQIQGPYGVGKTTLCLNMIAGMKGAKVLYIDSEASLNPELLRDLQVDPANFTLYNESANLEDIAEVIRAAAKNGTHQVIVFDSLAMTTTKSIAEGEITASNIGQKAKLMHKLISLVQMDLKRTNTAFVVINQEREVLGSYTPQKYTPGGMAVPYAASLMISLKTIKSWRFPKDPKDGIYQGQEVEATIIKSKVNQPWRTAKFKLYYPKPVAAAVTDMSSMEDF